jgi:NADH-quinone oxidoreductase subunit C
VDAQAIFDLVSARVPGGVSGFQPGGVADGARDGGFTASAATLLPVMAALRDEPALRFDFLQNMTAVDWPKRGAIEVIYHLFSYAHRHEICARVEVPRADPVVPSVTSLWRTADWLEREQFDLFGVIFDGHGDLRRLLMPDDWVGHPMRKDYREPKSYRGMSTSRPSPLDLLVEYDRAHDAAGKPRGGAA